MTVNSTKMELCFKSCLEARPGFSVLKEPDQLTALISPTKDNLASCLTWSFSFSIPKIINLLLQVYQDGTTALQNHTASILPRLQPGMKLHWHHATWSFTESIKSKTEAVIGYISICYPSTFNIGDIILLPYGKLTRLGFFFFHSWSSSIEQNAVSDDSTALGKGMNDVLACAPSAAPAAAQQSTAGSDLKISGASARCFSPLHCFFSALFFFKRGRF